MYRSHWIPLTLLALSVWAGCGSDTDPAGGDDCVSLPAEVAEDLTVGPGCVLLDETIVDNEAELTIAPGTTVRVERFGSLTISRALVAPDDGARLIAVGTEDAPIVFTSAAEMPAPGDWRCIFLGAEPLGTRLDHVVLEYGGFECGPGRNPASVSLFVAGPTDQITNTTIRSSAGHGALIGGSASIRDFSGNTFEANALPSLSVDANQLVSLGSMNVFADPDDFVEVTGADMNRDGTIRAQPVPYRFLNEPAVGTAGAQPEITVAGGVRFELLGTNFVVSAGNMVVEGTEAEPVVFTSASEMPRPGDWGCLWYLHGQTSSQNTGVPTLSHAQFEYAGGGGCANLNDLESALVVTANARLDALSFTSIAGHALYFTAESCPPDACDHDFTDLAAEPLSCGGTPTDC